MYLPWTELGKKPFDYWSDGEPNNEERVMELCKAHFTFRAQFFIALKSNKPKSFPQEFIDWFSLFFVIIFQTLMFSIGIQYNKKIINYSAITVYVGMIFFFFVVFLNDVKITSQAFLNVLKQSFDL